jgi:hypothetical protein
MGTEGIKVAPFLTHGSPNTHQTLEGVADPTYQLLEIHSFLRLSFHGRPSSILAMVRARALAWPAGERSGHSTLQPCDRIRHVVDQSKSGLTERMTDLAVSESGVATGLYSPFDLKVETIAGFLNAEIAHDPTYDGFELQWFDDPSHGAGMLAFLSRRESRLVDYYVDPDLRLDREGYVIGGGTGRWVETIFDVAHLQIGSHGVVADVRFTDLDGRQFEVSVDDRAAGSRRPTDLLAPVSSGIDRPTSLMLVYLHGFDLLRQSDTAPTIRIDGRRVSTGSLPGSILHRRHLIKAASPLTVATVCRNRYRPLPEVDPQAPCSVSLNDAGKEIVGVIAAQGDGEARMSITPPLPPLGQLENHRTLDGEWTVDIDGDRITGGVWQAVRRDGIVELVLDVTRGWSPARRPPLLMSVVTRLMPVFRRWPTTYRWTAQIDLHDDPPTMTSRWKRRANRSDRLYRRATRS